MKILNFISSRFSFRIILIAYLATGTNLINGQNWQLIQPEYETSDAFVAGYSVKDFGASGDGITDVTSIFQQKIDALGAIGGGTLFVPRGKYVIKGKLILRKGVVLRGEWQKPQKGNSINGTILLAYSGRGNEEATSFITMEPASGVMDIAIWYPEQDPGNITKYPPTILLGEPYYFGNDYCNIKNVTLVNSYTGIVFSRVNGGTCPVIKGIYGTPLSRGIEIDNISDVGRIENIQFSPLYWEGSGLPGSPAVGNIVEKWIFANGTGIVMRRNDWSYTCFVNIEGYNMGLHVGPSIASPGASANGHNYAMTFTRCNTGIFFEAISDVGIMYTKIMIENCNNGLTFGPQVKYPVQLHSCNISAIQNAISTDPASSVKLMIQKCTINKGQVAISGGTFTASDCDFNDSLRKIIIGNAARGILTGDRFRDTNLIENNSIYSTIINHSALTIHDLPEYTDTLPRTEKPSRLIMYNAALAPFNAKNDGITDNTTAIQQALDAASTDGGGIVFLPPGKYKVLGTLSVPGGVELKGASDLGSAPMGQGSILEVYFGRGNESASPFISLAGGSGLRGLVFDYPEQMGDSVPNFKPYPYCIQVQGADVYIVNVGMRATYNGIDLFSYECDNHYLDYVAGQVFKSGIVVGGNSVGGKISNLQFNPIGYVYGYESKWGLWPNAPSPANIQNIVNYIKDNMNFLTLKNCSGETLYDDFLYGSQSGLILSGASGLSLGLGIDGSRKSLIIESIGASGFDFINSQIVSIDNVSGTCYIETKSSFTSDVTFFSSDYWGYCEYGILQDGGLLNFELANFQYPGSSGFANVSSGALSLQNSAVTPVGMLLVKDDEPRFSAESSILDSSGISTSACSKWKNNLSNAYLINAGKFLDRTGWKASASINNSQAGLGIDGNPNTRWSPAVPQANGQTYVVDMQTNHYFNNIILDATGSPFDYPIGYQVYVSTDSINWGSAVASGNGTSMITIINFAVQNARYIKVVETGSSGIYWWSVYEFYVFNSNSNVPVTGMGIIPSSIKLAVNANYQLTDSLTPGNTANNPIDWSSSDTTIVKVDNTGMITAVASGSVVITARSSYDGVSATSVVTAVVPVTGISILETSVSLNVDSVEQLAAMITPIKATFKGVFWNSSDLSVAVIDENGKVTGRGVGSAFIIASSLDNNISDSIPINVTGTITGFTVYFYVPASWAIPEKIFWWNAIPADSLANGSWPGVPMDTAVSSYSGWYKYTFSNIYSTNLIFNDNNGNQTINLSRSSDGWYLDNVWYDSDPSHVTSVLLSPSLITAISPGDTIHLTATLSPAYAMNKSINWISDNPSVATVGAGGLGTAVSEGSANITATSLDGAKTGSATINVTANTSLKTTKLDNSSLVIYPNPARDYTYLKINLMQNSYFNISIYNLNGTNVYSEDRKVGTGNQLLKLNISTLKAGVYYVRLTSNELVITKKLLVK